MEGCKERANSIVRYVHVLLDTVVASLRRKHLAVYFLAVLWLHFFIELTMAYPVKGHGG